jgi:hypothetical protein
MIFTEKKRVKNGWGFPWLARKAHYFVNGQSLCRRWVFGGLLEQENDESPDNCKTCIKLLKKERENKKNAS